MDLRDQLQRRLGNAYTLHEELRGGGMSRVFVAEETSLGRRVVVKVLPPELTGGVNIDRFRREILMAAKLQHPHIVPVLSAGELDGLPYYTMPLVEEKSLRTRLSESGALPIAEAIGILGDVAKALAYAHGRGIVHRDIKPDNVLVCGAAALVTDFGIAKALAASTLSTPSTLEKGAQGAALTNMGMAMGTPAYMAPEQAAADPTMDHRADTYAFGCMAYELLTGRPPFTHSSPRKLLAAQMAEVPQPVQELRADAPPALAALVMRCLEKDPNDRPQQVNEIVRLLDNVATGEHPTAPWTAIRPSSPRKSIGRALAIYCLAFIPVAVLAEASIVALRLPAWVLPGVLGVMVLALPLFIARSSSTRRTTP
jgi:serine/threonine protein kinase